MLEKKSDHISLTAANFSDLKNTFDAILKKVPTGGNSKPFVWQWIENELYVRHDQKLAEHYLNRDNHTSKIAFGCLIESLQTVCQELRLKHQMQIEQDALSLRFTILETSAEVTAGNQIAALLNRSTYRGLMNSKVKSAPINLDQWEGAFVNQSASQDFLSYLKLTANYIWHQQQATIDFFKEIRFFSKVSSNEKRGIPTFELCLPVKDLLALKMFSLVPKLLVHLMKLKPIEKIFFENTQRLLEGSNFVLICAPSASSSDLIQTGRRALKIWLDLENQGFHVQPLSTATIPIVDAVNNVLPADTHPAFREIYEQQGLKLLKKEFSMKESLIPVWLFRVGKKLED